MWKEAKAALFRRVPTGAEWKGGATRGNARLAPARPEPSPEQLSPGEGWNHVCLAIPACDRISGLSNRLL